MKRSGSRERHARGSRARRRLATALATALTAGILGASMWGTRETAEVVAPTLVDSVEVAHDRELRGLWVATVANLDWPSRPGLPAERQQAELIDLLDRMQHLGLNAIVFQVRSESDAMYASPYEPWSRVLTGQQGVDPGYDPLELLVREAHARNVEVHAWFNPYRAGTVVNDDDLAPNHIGRAYPQHMHRYGKFLWMDPGAKEVQDRTVDVVLDVARRYDIDGVHFDDYFYPYPEGREFPDERSWQPYVASGGTLSRDDWRRHNVDSVIERISEGLSDLKPHVRFGISPFGIYRPGQPAGIRGLDQYATIYADPVRWMDEGWVDYLAPQLYWPTTRQAQAFEPLIDWWSAMARGGRHIFAGHALYQLGQAPEWTTDEFRTQVALTRKRKNKASKGQIWFRARHLLDRDDTQSLFRDELYGAPALTPPVAALADVEVAEPEVTADARGVAMRHIDHELLRSWAIYRPLGRGWTLDRVVPADVGRVDLPAGRYAISAVGRSSVESRGVVVDVGADSVADAE